MGVVTELVLNEVKGILRLAEIVIPRCGLCKQWIGIDGTSRLAGDRTYEHRVVEGAGSLLLQYLERWMISIEKIE